LVILCFIRQLVSTRSQRNSWHWQDVAKLHQCPVLLSAKFQYRWRNDYLSQGPGRTRVARRKLRLS
jgi:hypothetical protein